MTLFDCELITMMPLSRPLEKNGLIVFDNSLQVFNTVCTNAILNLKVANMRVGSQNISNFVFAF